jgi:predicted nucleotide-binding protein (sugar kinase/HSP70/actin superfamily)
MIVGIPKSLVYWKRPHFWGEFFNKLGCEVLFSLPTNKEIVEKGVKNADPETCFSNKVYWGHLLWLDKKCDAIFIPRLKTDSQKLEYCPKFFGLPDLGKILVKTPILTETFDEKKESFQKSLEKLGKKLGKNKKQVKIAFQSALSKEEERRAGEERNFFEKMSSEKTKIILISHPYNLYDDYINLRVREKLEKLGVQPILIDEVPLGEDLRLDFNEPVFIDFHWEFAKKMIEKIHKIFNYNIKGGVEISSFQCGCDGVLKEFVEKEFKVRKIPFLYLILDEHTGDAGFQTRLEAFIDTLTFR